MAFQLAQGSFADDARPAGPLDEPSSNEHTAKFRIFADKAREKTGEGRYEEAEAWWQRAQKEAQEGFGRDDMHMAVVANGLAELYRLWGGAKFLEAEKYYLQSVAVLEREAGASDVRYAQAQQYLGQYYLEGKRFKEALVALQKSAAVKKAALGAHHADFCNTLGLVAVAQQGLGQPHKAIATLEACLASLEATARDEGSVASELKRRLVAVLLETKQTRKAIAAVQTLMNAARNVHIPEHVAIVRSLEDVVRAALVTGEAAALRSSAELMLEVRRAALCESDPAYASSLRLLAEVNLASKCRKEQAEGARQALHSAALLSDSWLAAERNATRALQPRNSWPWQRPPQPPPHHHAFVALRLNASALELAKAALLCYSLPASEVDDARAAGVLLVMMAAVKALTDPKLDGPLRDHSQEVPASEQEASREPTRLFARAECRRLDMLCQLLLAQQKQQRADPRYASADFTAEAIAQTLSVAQERLQSKCKQEATV